VKDVCIEQLNNITALETRQFN